MRLLYIAIEFGPIQTTGAFRSIAFAKRLPAFSIEPHILTLAPEDGAVVFAARRDDRLLAEMPPAVEISHLAPATPTKRDSGARQLLRMLTSLDDRFFQRYQASLASWIRANARRVKPELVLVTAPPFGAARLGELAAEMLGVPWVLDMRDAWADWSMAPFPTRWHYEARRRDEARAFRSASAIVTVTEQLAGLFRHQHTDLPFDKFHVVPNGFDGPLFRDGAITTNKTKSTYDIGYVGSFYYTPPKPKSLRRPHSLLQYDPGLEDWSYRSPLYFFRAWRELANIAPRRGASIRFHHFGSAPDWLHSMAAEHGFGEQFKAWGILTKQELGLALEHMDAQLATSMKRLDGGDYCLASKTFDYLVTGKPILALVTEGAQRDFLMKSRAAVICDPDDMAGAAANLRNLIEGRVELGIDASFVNRFHRRETTRALARILRAHMPVTRGEVPA